MNKSILTDSFKQTDIDESKLEVVCFNLIYRVCFILMLKHQNIIPDSDIIPINIDHPDIKPLAIDTFDVVLEKVAFSAKEKDKNRNELLFETAISMCGILLNSDDTEWFVREFYEDYKRSDNE